ncbi:DUF4435 domain-containing protein [Acinetobacter calcoaceticus]|uniref:DUF4435 domain-containing protein n=1 Tax=Acinetobacter calcoaceticus TaxID=471 RepID=UPI0019014EB1|nr:DUF4435 domain-containing protein [Acinetobacter calcoaceticus]MBJ9722893.1 DUF4435 domain-containing protein [Acinetobacter calcoaceticus]
MSSLDYSLDALNLLNAFHQVDKVIYVEGQDDVPFWEFLFKKFTNLNIYIEDVGGKENLQPYIKKIEHETVDFIVAKDLDYDSFLDKGLNGKSVLTTAGYSIENTLIDKNTLFYVVKKLSLLPDSKIERNEFDDWLLNINSVIKKLILFGIHNELTESGVSVVPTNADRFMVSKNSAFLCSEKIDNYLEKIHLIINEDELTELLEKVNALNKDYLDLLNGHFYFSAAHRLVTLKSAKLKSSTKAGKIQCSSETFLALLMSAFENCFNSEHIHYAHYHEQFSLVG